MINYAEAVEKQLDVGRHTNFANDDENDNYIDYAETKAKSVLDLIDSYDIKFDSGYTNSIEELRSSSDDE